ncbi:zinc ribbon domain-containing protein [Thermodesulfobacteriota bacterium]
MECPHCHKEIPGKECPQCGESIQLESHYCMNCGVNLEERQEEVIEEDNGFDLEDRVLCPDGTCNGIIIDGKCSECGKPFKGT